MKKIITGACILALSFGMAQAQTATDAGGKEKQHKERMMQEMKALNLTVDQKAQVKALREEQKAQAEQLKAQGNLTADEQKAKHKELAQQYEAKMQSILTEEQKAQLAQTKGKMEEKRRGHQGTMMAMGRDLELTKEQKEKMAQARAGFKAQAEEIRKNEALTAEQKKAKMQSLMEEHKKQLNTILTPEQIQKMKVGRRKRLQV